jgi:hypothetical protein
MPSASAMAGHTARQFMTSPYGDIESLIPALYPFSPAQRYGPAEQVGIDAFEHQMRPAGEMQFPRRVSLSTAP